MQDTSVQAMPGNGASNAADFQPGTQNPQTPGGNNLFPQTENGVQAGSQQELLDSSRAEISVPSNPAPAGSQATQPTSNNLFPLAAIALALVVLAVLLLRRRPSAPVRQEAVEVAEAKTEVIAPAPKPKKTTPKPAVKKPAPKKSKSQRKKRARR